MDVYSTEEEQIKAIKDWWNKNGTALFVGIFCAIIAASGWWWWKVIEKKNAESASVVYQQALDNLQKTIENKDSDAAEKFEIAVTQLQSEFPASNYANLAVLLQARNNFFGGDLDLAEKQLREIVDKNKNLDIDTIARLRLAKVLFEKGSDNDALTVLSEKNPPAAYSASYSELKGDIFFGSGDKKNAYVAYQAAVLAAKKSGEHRPQLSIKLDDLSSE